MPISKIKQGAYRVLEEEKIKDLLHRTPAISEVQALPLKVNVKQYVIQRATILEDKINRGEIKDMEISQISAMITREVVELGYDDKTVRKNLPFKYKNPKFMSWLGKSHNSQRKIN